MEAGSGLAASQPILVKSPTISGVAQVGRTLTTTDSVWRVDGFSIVASERVWDRCSSSLVSDCAAIQKDGVYADGKSYVLTNADLGSVIRVWNGLNVPGWTTSAISAPTAVVTVMRKARIGAVTVTGPSRVGKGQAATYRIRISNSGNATASGVRVK